MRHPGSHPQTLDRLDRVVQLRARLGMDAQDVRACLRELFDELLGMLDHQVHGEQAPPFVDLGSD